MAVGRETTTGGDEIEIYCSATTPPHTYGVIH